MRLLLAPHALQSQHIAQAAAVNKWPGCSRVNLFAGRCAAAHKGIGVSGMCMATPTHHVSHPKNSTPHARSDQPIDRKEQQTEPSPAPSEFTRWLRLSEDRSLARLHGPIVEAARRIGLSSSRADALHDQVQGLSTTLLNLPRTAPPDHKLRLEERLLGLEERLHRERAELWRDLLPLAREARDAGIEQARGAWLAELAKALGDSKRGDGDEQLRD